MRCRSSGRWAVFAAVALALGSLLSPSRAQEAPRIIDARVEGGALAVAWVGDAEYVVVQATPDLREPAWFPVAITSEDSVAAPLEGAATFVRVAPANGPSASAEISDEQRLEALDQIVDFIDTLDGEDEAENRAALLSFLASFDAFDVVGATADGSLYANFTDGLPLLIVDNRPAAAADEFLEEIELSSLSSDAPSRGLTAAAAARRANFAPAADTPPAGLPTSRLAVFAQASGIGLKAPMIASLSPAFDSRGFDVVSIDATVPNLLALSALADPIGVFYVDSHGGIVHAREKVVADARTTFFKRVPEFAFVTSTQVTPANFSEYRPLLRSGQLAIGMVGPTVARSIKQALAPGAAAPRSMYIVRRRFVETQLRFSQNSFVYIDTCLSGHPYAQSFREACYAAGASQYAGWTSKVHDAWAYNYTTRVLFDALLGGSRIFARQPRQRPFDLSSVLEYMEAKGYLQDHMPSFFARLAFFPGPPANGAFGLLAPSIRSMSLSESDGRVFVQGLFDPDAAATVQVESAATQEIAAESVARNLLIFPLPAEAQPSVGKITVRQAGLGSNRVPLSEWRFPLDLYRQFAIGEQQPTAKLEFDLRFRGDAHSYRETPYGPPTFPPFGVSTAAARGSTGRLASASGVYFYPGDRGTVEWQLDSPVTLQLVYSERPDNWFASSISLRADGAATLTVNLRAADAIRVVDILDGVENVSQRDPTASVTSPGPSNASWSPSTFAIDGNTWTNGANVALWADVQATYPPDQDDEEYAE